MLAFKIWGNFASFRDPLTISQNLSLPLPPKTTVGGMMASILGIDNYFKDEEYFDFSYSCIMLNEVRKKSFSQNYIEKYTNRVGTKISNYENVTKKYKAVQKVKDKLFTLEKSKEELLSKNQLKKAEEKKLDKLPIQIEKEQKNIEKKMADLDKTFKAFRAKQNETFTKSKPTNRELILNPSYLIVIDNFKYEKKLIQLLKRHYSIYPFYLGNSEFAGNFEYIESQIIDNKIDTVNSFCSYINLIDFDFGQKYSNMTMPLQVIGNRQYKEYKKIIFSDRAIKLKEKIEGLKLEFSLNNQKMELGCEFI